MTTPTPQAPTAGYVSEESKRTFTTVVGVLGALFFFLQFAVPMVAIFALMPRMMMSMDFVRFDVEGAAVFEGDVYLVESTHALRERRDSSERTRLVRLAAGEIEPVAALEGWQPRLLSDSERLWLISSDRVSTFADGKLTALALPEPRGDFFAPFLLEGRPAVVESRPERSSLLVWMDGGWVEQTTVPDGYRTCCTQFLAVGSLVTAFTSQGDTLYARGVGDPEWAVVASEPRQWRAFLRGSAPAVAVLDSTGGLRVLERYEDGWRVVLRAGDGGSGLASGLAVFQDDDRERLTTLWSTFPGSLRLRTWEGSRVVAEERFGRSSPFPREMMAMMWLPHLGGPAFSLLLAVILSWLMRTHRVGVYSYEGREVDHASVTRRAVSQLVDAVILLAPGAFFFARFFEAFGDPELMFGEGWGMFRYLGYLTASLAWGGLLFVAFAASEGLWGLTPGKWIAGIRVVGTDLEPCGVGRALVRNLLKLVDGFFSFLVGILMVAYTQDWQRLGDLAARTIVIRAGGGSRG